MLAFLKLGGSLITDKAQAETARPDVITRLAGEIAAALYARPDLRLVVGHGSGSFGHTAASEFGTRGGVAGQDAWRGFARVAVVARRLNHIVLEALHGAGVPVFAVQPSASAVCQGGVIERIETAPLRRALDEGLVPLVYGDVAVDEVQGGTIISTEDIFTYLAHELRPARILLAGEYDGVLDGSGQVVPHITPATLDSLHGALGGSGRTDVTGGMETKVKSMLVLCAAIPGLEVHIFNGQVPGAVEQALSTEHFNAGTRLSAE